MLLVLPVAAPAARAHDQPSGITVTGSAEAKGAPDVAYVTLAVVTQDTDAGKAAQANAAATQKLIDAIQKFPVPRQDIETTGYSLQPVQDYKKSPPVTVGYQATNQVQVKLRDLTRVGALIDAGIAAGANSAQGVRFTTEDDTSIRQEAMVQAIKNAQAKARVMADTLGVKLGGVVAATEQGAPPVRPFEMGAVRAEAPSTPILPGQIEVQASVTLVYAIL